MLSPIQGDVLDVGCGAQPYRRIISPAGELPGHRLRPGPNTTSATRCPDTTYYEGDCWPVDNASVDVILCTETLEHVPDPSVFLAEAARCLRPGGWLLLTVPFAARWHYIPHDYWRFTPSGLQRLLAAAGFERDRRVRAWQRADRGLLQGHGPDAATAGRARSCAPDPVDASSMRCGMSPDLASLELPSHTFRCEARAAKTVSDIRPPSAHARGERLTEPALGTDHGVDETTAPALVRSAIPSTTRSRSPKRM